MSYQFNLILIPDLSHQGKYDQKFFLSWQILLFIICLG